MAKRVIDITADLDAGTTRTIPLYQALEDGVLQWATMTQEGDPDGDKTFKIRNHTQSKDMTSATDIDAVGPLVPMDLPVLTTPGAVAYKKDDLLVGVYTVNTAGTVHPAHVQIQLEVADGVGSGDGPAWSG